MRLPKPKKRKRKKTHGFRVRSRSRVLKDRRRKGRRRLIPR